MSTPRRQTAESDGTAAGKSAAVVARASAEPARSPHGTPTVDSEAPPQVASGPRAGQRVEPTDIRWLPEVTEARLHQLATKLSAGTLDKAEAAEYEALVNEAQCLMVQNARALTRRRGAAAAAKAQAEERRALQEARRAERRAQPQLGNR